MDVVIGRLPGNFLGRREQRADVHIETDIGEGRRDHLLPAVVAVLTHLGDKDARPTAIGLGELLDQPGRLG